MYIAYIGSNGQLHNIIEIIQGAGVFVIAGSVALTLIAYVMEKRNIPAYTFFVPLIVVMLCRRLWNIDWPYVEYMGLANYDVEIKILSILILVILSVKLSLKLKHKALNIALIFVVAGLYAYSGKAYHKTIESYESYKLVSSQQFKDKIENKITAKKNYKPFVNKFNVYHILIDSYPNKKRLKEMTGYDLNPFYNQLQSRGLRTYDVAYSPGTNTFVTLNIMFNMKYQKKYNDYHYYGINKTFLTFLSQDYKVFCDYPCLSGAGNIGQWNKNIYTSNVDNLFYIWRSFINYYFGAVMPIYTAGDIDAFGAFNDAVGKMQPDQNYFMYMHEVKHPGFFTENITAKKNKATIELIDLIIAKDKNAIIIFGSDHGSRNEWSHFKNAGTAEALFSIVQAVKFPPACDRFNNIDILTPVNYYKYIFACLRGEKTVSDLQPNESYKQGAVDDFWNEQGDEKTYIYIRDNQILNTPEIVK